MSWFIAIFLILSMGLPVHAFDLLSFFEKSNDDLFPHHEEYDFNSCSSYSSSSKGVRDLHCEFQHLSHILDQPGIKDQRTITKKVIEQALTEEFRLFVLKNIKTRIEEQERLKDCFSILSKSSARVSTWCENKAQVIREESRERLPKMRMHLALMTPVDASERRLAYQRPQFQVQSRLRHTRNKHPITPITPIEIPTLQAQFNEETETYTQEWMKKFFTNNCIMKNHQGLYQFKNSYCEQSMQIALNDHISVRREMNKTEHEKIYQELLSVSPHLTFMSHFPLPQNDSELNQLLSTSFNELQKQSIVQLELLKKRRNDKFHFLYRYPQLIEAFLQEKGASQLLCDAFQHIHDFQGEGGWYDLASDLGLALGAIAGGGACLLSSGFACATVVAIGTEAIYLGLEQSRLNDGLTLYRAGMIESDHVSSLESSRNFALALAPLAFVGLEAGKGIARGFTRRHHNRASLKEMQHWLHFNATTPAQNRLWIQSARNKTGQIYLDVENAALKRLNDSLGDKNVVTALTNLHKDILFKEIEKLKERYPSLVFESYSDFKSSRFSFRFQNEGVPADFQQQLNEMMKKVSEQFDNKVQEMSSIDIGNEIPSRWFASGLGESADQAGLAARQARVLDRTQSNIYTFDAAAPLLSQRRHSVEASRKRLELSFNVPPLNKLLTKSSSGVPVPTVDVFEVLRKTSTKSPEEFQKIFKMRFNIDLSSQQTQLLRQYAQDVDQFSPGLWIEERVLANLDNAEYGGFSADFKGMGARNLHQVAVDLSYSADTLAQNVDRLRAGEGLVTQGFDVAKNSYDDLIKRELNRMGVGVTNRCSGDDCVSLPSSVLTREQEQQIVQAIAQSGQADAYRLSFIPPGIRAQDRTLLGVHGELIEKQLRSHISGYMPGQISPEVMAKVTFAVRMPTRTGTGNIEIITATDPSLQLSEELKKNIKRAVASATESVNKDLGTEYAY